jgi:protein-S-isoprenylcysteine O-methyltransferase Ste14
MNWADISVEQASDLAGGLWLALAVVWLVMWFQMKKAKKRESPLERLQYIVPLVLGLLLLFGKGWKMLNTRVVPDIPAVLWSGLLVTAIGVGISIWARVSLGANWSGTVTLKQDHELVCKGLYRWIRHPIYTGMLTGYFGTEMIKGHLRGWLGLALVWIGFYLKAKREEKFLQQEFGAGFEEHKRHTGMFLPKLI